MNAGRLPFENMVGLITSGQDWAGFTCMSLNDWIDQNQHGLVAPLPLGLLLDAADINRLPLEISAALDAAHVPVAAVTNPELDAATIVGWAATRVQRALGDVNDLRRANAALRVQHEILQRNFDTAEGWLHTMHAPRFVRLRHFPPDQMRVQLEQDQPIQQPLPAAARGLTALDFWIDAPQGATIGVQICDFQGIALATTQMQLLKGATGWQRAQLLRAIGGAETDVYVSLELREGAEVELALALPTAVQSYHARRGPDILERPLAMTLWAGLPEVSLPAVGYAAAQTMRYLVPAELPTPTPLCGSVELFENPGVITLRPAATGTGAAILRDVDFGKSTQIEAFVQVFGNDGASVTINAVAPGVIADRADLYRLDTGQFLPANQPARIEFGTDMARADLVVRIENAHPGSALNLWALHLDDARA